LKGKIFDPELPKLPAELRENQEIKKQNRSLG